MCNLLLRHCFPEDKSTSLDNLNIKHTCTKAVRSLYFQFKPNSKEPIL